MLAALPVLVVVFAVAVIPMTVTSTTKIHRVLVGNHRMATMSDSRTTVSELRTKIGRAHV